MKEQLQLAWRINNNKNLLLLAHVTDDALKLAAGPGRTIGQQLSHLHNNRITWLEFTAKSLYQKADLIDKNAVVEKKGLQDSFAFSEKKIEELISISWDKEGRLPSFKTGLIPFIAYLISHESHHRGNILLTLKQNKQSLPDELKWGLWEWNK